MKVCTRCLGLKPLEAFSRDKSKRDGLTSTCKACKITYDVAYRKANPDKVRARIAAWRAANPDRIRNREAAWRKANPEKIRTRGTARQAAWRTANPDKVRAGRAAHYAANPEKARARSAAYRKANPDKVRAGFAAWQKANPDKTRAAYHRRRALLRGGIVEHFTDLEIFKRDNWLCGICGEPIDRSRRHPDPGSPSLDHIIPISKGGWHVRANTQAAHLTCNIRKGARMDEGEVA